MADTLTTPSMEQWYYAKAGQQHGPVGIEELRGLIASGAINPASDLVWNAGMKDWLPAAQIPVLVGAAASPRPPDLEPAQPFAYPTATGVFTDIPSGSEPLIPTACVKRAFDLTVRHIGPILLITILYVVIGFVVSLLLQGLDSVTGWEPMNDFYTRQFDSTAATGFSYSIGTEKQLSFPSSVLSTIVSVFFMLGLTRIGLNLVSAKAFDVGMLFSGGKWLVRGFLGYILFTIMLIVGLLLLVVPGIIVLIRFGMYQNAIVDRNMGVIDSLKYSWNLTAGNSLNLFVILLFSVLIMVAGCMALIIGLLFAFPMIWVMWIVAYRWLQYGGRTVQDDPLTGRPLLAGAPE